MYKNASMNHEVAKTMGRKVLGAGANPYNYYRVGSFLIRAAGLWSMLQVWNHLFFDDEEKELPEGIRSRPHIVLGRNSKGEVIYFSRIGALGDLLEWVGLDAAPHYVDQMFKGRMSPKDVALDMVKSAPNVLIQGGEPVIKMLGETLTRRSLFPDVFEPRAIRDRTLHLFRGFGLEKEYMALSGKPTKKAYWETLPDLAVYSYDPLQAGYSDIMELKRQYKKKIGKGGEGFWISDRGNALFNIKMALRYGDEKAAVEYTAKYLKLANVKTPQQAKKAIRNIHASIERMEPLAGLTKEEKKDFVKTLRADEREQLYRAYLFYEELLAVTPRYIKQQPATRESSPFGATGFGAKSFGRKRGPFGF
jgi:hypothetical protein